MKNYCLLLALVLFLFPSCKDNCHSSVPGCCDNDAVQEQIGVGKIYIPNVFSPNFDGVNDVFLVYADTGINQIISFEVFSNTGDLVLRVSNLPINNPNWGWDGTVEGVVETGLFTYKVEVQSIDGVTKVVEGAVCSFPCEETVDKEPAFDAIANCRLGRQNDRGTFNPAIDPGERWDCIEQ